MISFAKETLDRTKGSTNFQILRRTCERRLRRVDQTGARAGNYIGEQLQVGTSSRSVVAAFSARPGIPTTRNALRGMLLSWYGTMRETRGKRSRTKEGKRKRKIDREKERESNITSTFCIKTWCITDAPKLRRDGKLFRKISRSRTNYFSDAQNIRRNRDEDRSMVALILKMLYGRAETRVVRYIDARVSIYA